MKSSHDPKMSIVSSMLSNVGFPPLIKNKAAHSVKSECFKSNGTAEDKAHMGASRHGGTKSTKHAYLESEGRDHKHVGVVSEDRDQGSRTRGDMSMSTSTSMGSDGDKGMSMGMSMGMGKDVGTADSALCIGKVRRKPGPEEHSASEGDAHSTSALEPKVLGRNMDDPLSNGMPFVGLSLQTGATRQ